MNTVEQISAINESSGKILLNYFLDMQDVITEMYRVLKPAKSAIVVIGNSIIKGIDTNTPYCLSEIGYDAGFLIPDIGIRKIDRNRRMLPAGRIIDLNSQIQNRMHQEYIIGFYKPELQ